MHNPLKAIVHFVTLTLVVLLSIANPAPAQPSAQTKPAILLGTAWYPEQWPESRWDADLALMQAAHIHFVRVGEFAWSKIEPSEGQYDLDWLERAVAAAARHHIAVVIGTPTAAPPAWLTTKYPETLRIKEDGRRDEHGNRQQFNCASPKYREFAARMAEQMAKRFGHDPNVIGWQIDNEVRRRLLRRADQAAIPRLAQGPLRHPRQSQRPMDHRLLEPDLQRLVQVPIDHRRAIPASCSTGSASSPTPGAATSENQLDVIRANADHASSSPPT